MRNSSTAALLLALLALGLVAAANAAGADGSKRLAVLEFELANGVKLDRTYFSDLARGAVKRSAPQLFVMTRESTQALLQANGRTLADCTGECEVEVGRKLGADYIISGRMTQIGSHFVLTVRLFSTADGALLGDEEADGRSLDQLFDQAKGAIGRLVKPLGSTNAASVAPALAATAAPAPIATPAPAAPSLNAASAAPGGAAPAATSAESADHAKVEPKSGLELVQLSGGVLVGGNFPGARVAPFALGRTATTVAAYRKCVAAGACTEAHDGGDECNGKAGRENHPINCVDWHQAVAFCRWIGGRLPKAEEREWAASSGEGREYPWGAEAPGNQLCWNGEGNDLGKGNRKTTCPVGAYPAGRSKQGILDLAGNVSEWLDADYNSGKVVRGGPYYLGEPFFFRASGSDYFAPEHWRSHRGFRCAQ